MAKLLLIMGDLAAGKSTFAKMLSKKHGIPYFSKDSIKEVLGDSIGFQNRAENLKLSKATFQIMLHIYKEFAEQNMDLILESNFHEKELESLHQIAVLHNYNILTLVFRGDIPTLHQRYLNRISSGHRHPVHLSTTFEKFEDFQNYIMKCRKEQPKGKYLTINANDFSYQEDEEILKKVNYFFNQK